jgi:DNA-binding PadR family transcriptional regulator
VCLGGTERATPYTLLKEMRKRRRFAKALGGISGMKSTIYNTIKGLEESGYIKAIQKTENGRNKVYYTITGEGKKVLRSAKRLITNHLKELSSILK